MLCDSNLLIYAADPADSSCLPFVLRDDAGIASVTRIEVLGFPGWTGLTENQRRRLTEIVVSLPKLGLTATVIQQATSLRQRKKMSLADAVIPATPLVHHPPLVTRNVGDFQHIRDLKIINPFDDQR